MKSKQIFVFSTILMGLFIGTTLVASFGFEATPTLTDPYDDQGAYDADIIKIWIDNNATHIMFKIDFNNTYEVDPSTGHYFFVHISTNPLTGSEVWSAGFLVDYYLWLRYQGWLDFYDVVNSSNDLANSNSVGLSYYRSSNNNHTLELGYKLNTHSPSGEGFLNLVMGQSIDIRFASDITTDWCPDTGTYTYVLTEGDDDGIPGFELPLLSLVLLGIILVYSIQRKRGNL